MPKNSGLGPTNNRPRSGGSRSKSSTASPRRSRRAALGSPSPGQPGSAGACRYCRTTIRPDYNYCSHCGMPIDPAHDRPLFVVEGLTNLFNVVFFESLLEQELNRAGRYGHDLSILVAEIDDLAELEAAYGYEETNRMVREVGEIIATAIRDPDTLAATNRVAALGTTRFLVLLPETAEEGAFRAAEKIRSLVDSTVLTLGDGAAVVTVSLGVASTSQDSSADANLVARASQALIDSRVRGNNRIQVATASA